MTQLTFDTARTLAKTWSAGDEVVVSRLDHHANVRPWVIAAEKASATVRWIDFDPASTDLTVQHVTDQLGDRTRLVALTSGSNLLGTRPDLAAVAEQVHRAGALFYVDGVHLTAHAGIDVAALGADFFVCSPYKFFGPHCGVVAASPDLLDSLRPDKLLPAKDVVPERFELGTLAYELLTGTCAARSTRLPEVSRCRLRSSSQIDTPASVSAVSGSLMVFLVSAAQCHRVRSLGSGVWVRCPVGGAAVDCEAP